MSLSPRQQQVFGAVRAHWIRHGYSPTLREIAVVVGLSSLSTVHQYVQELCAKGYLRRPSPRARVLELVERDESRRPYPTVIAPREWLTERADDRPAGVPEIGDLPHSLFLHDERQWRAIRAMIEPGDELWAFTSPAERWADLCGRRGYAIVRGGEVVDGILTAKN